MTGGVVPLRDRGRYQGILGAVFGVTTVIGPLLGGYFTDYLTWRWAFWGERPALGGGHLRGGRDYPALATSTKPVIDYAGIAFVGLGAAGLTLATSWGGTLYPRGSATIIGLFVGVAVALCVFVWVESRAAEPILPTHMQYVDGVSATTSGLRTLPMVVGMLITSTGSGTLVGRTGRYQGRPDRREVEAALERNAHRVLAQRDWHDDRRRWP